MQHSASFKGLFQAIVFTAFVFDFTWITSGKECGQRKVKYGDLMLGGVKTYSGKWPWHVAIAHPNRSGLQFVCGGSIINKNTILTAAHCLYDGNKVLSMDRLKVHVGRSLLSVEDQYTKEYVPAEFLIHPDHVLNSVRDDIALIKLENDIQMNDYVQPVCVCQDADESQIVGRNGTVMGFGLDINGTQPDHLLEATLPFVKWMDCLDSNRAVFGMELTQKMLCAGARNAVGPCNGDSGGGFVFNTGDAWCVRGIVAFTSILENTNRCDPHQYVVYTDVAKYIGWLQNNTNAVYDSM